MYSVSKMWPTEPSPLPQIGWKLFGGFQFQFEHSTGPKHSKPFENRRRGRWSAAKVAWPTVTEIVKNYSKLPSNFPSKFTTKFCIKQCRMFHDHFEASVGSISEFQSKPLSGTPIIIAILFWRWAISSLFFIHFK